MAYQIKNRLYFLSEASKILSSSLDYNVTLANVAKLITDYMADYCMIDLLNDRGKMVRVAARSSDLKKKTLTQKMFDFPADPRNRQGIYYVAETKTSIFIPRMDYKWLKRATSSPEEREVVEGLGMNSFIFSPLMSRNEVIGVITIVSSKKGFSYTEEDVVLAEEIGSRAGTSVDKARLYKEAQDALETQRELSRELGFLSEASKILSSSLEYKTTLQNVAKLAVPRMADWCGVDIINDEGVIEQVAVVHQDPKKVIWAKKLRKERPIDPDATVGVPNAIRTKKSDLIPFITDEMLVAAAKNAKDLKLLRSLNFSSSMVVPIISGGRGIGAISFVMSDSKRHYDENALRIAEELASRASIAIENANLYKQTHDALRLREEFMSIAAHELRTPLTIILLHIQKAHSEIRGLMTKHTGMNEVLELLQKSERQGFRLSKLINELLDVSLAVNKKIRLDKERLELNDLVEDVLQLFAIQMKKRKTFIVFGREKQPIYGYWDRIRMEQVISNLISNAFKYGKNKPIDVTIEKDTKFAKIKIKDRGIGIKPEYKKEIFDLFKRAVEENDYTGLGIGLYISDQIVRAHGGEIEVKSRIGDGSVFTIKLPLGSQDS